MSGIKYDIKHAAEDIANDITNAQILYINHTIFETDFQQKPNLHSHDFVELLYFYSGAGFVEINSKETIPVEKNNILIINPKVDHSEFSSLINPLNYYVIAFSGLIFKSEQELISTIKIDSTSFKELNEIANNVINIFNEAADQKLMFDIYCNNCLQNILIPILRHLFIQPKKQSYTGLSKEVLYVIQYVDLNISSKITLDLLAKNTFIDKYQLERLFKKQVGMPIIQYIIKYRCDLAIDLLKNTNLSLDELSYKLGFSSVSYFLQQFKKQTGHTPINYRKHLKNS